MKNVAFLAIALILGGCTAPLTKVIYESPVTASKSFPVSVELNSGKVTGYSTSSTVYAGGVFVPISGGPAPKLHFGVEDQKVFIESLKSKLIRYKVAESIVENKDEFTLKIIVNFVQTEHFPDFQEYKITATLRMKLGDKAADKVYYILSSEGDGFWEKISTNASEGKSKAAQKLMNKIMADIHEFIG